MLIIGLAGGGEDRRDAVAAGVVAAGNSRIAAYAMYQPKTPVARENLLREVLKNARTDKGDSTALVLSQVTSLEEWQIVRNAGGVIWHVAGRPSGEIPIQPFKDLMVTWRTGGDRHYLDPQEALSETLVRQRRAAIAPRSCQG